MDHHPSELARLCRQQAECATDRWTASTLLDMAADYDALARALDGDAPEGSRIPAVDPGFMLRE